jgi:hypothetical protein
MRNPFRHRQQIRKHENAHKQHVEVFKSGNVSKVRIGAPAPNAQMFQKNPTTNVVFSTNPRYHEGMSGKEEKMNKSHRIAMAQALIAELAEAVERHGDTSGTRRLRAMVARMVAELLA